MGLSVCQSVCLSVCRRFNSLLDGLFVPQTILPTQRVMKISLIEGFFLKKLRCGDTTSTASVQLTTGGHFVCGNNVHELMHALMGVAAGAPSRRRGSARLVRELTLWPVKPGEDTAPFGLPSCCIVSRNRSLATLLHTTS